MPDRRPKPYTAAAMPVCPGISRIAVAGLALALAGAAAAAPPEGPLHVPSPDWREQVIYFVMTDRFADGDPANNDQGAGEFKAGDRTRYNGGDLAGLRQRLDYIQGLGATALWITPPVANQWLGPGGRYTGYHGYWAEHFKRVDPHLGSLADLQRLSRALHGRGMYLVQDIVVNHTGDFFRYDGGWDARDPARFYAPQPGSVPARPSQWPFSLNDPRDPAQRRAGIYHWTPDIADYTDPRQEADFQMSGLDDLNTGNPVVRRALRDSHGWWIRAAGVDAFRVDTAFYVPPDYFADFLHARDPAAPGIAEVARRTGRQDFLVFGEGFGIDRPFQDREARKIERWMSAPDGRPLLPGMLNFPLYGAFGDVFARGRPPAELGHRIAATMWLHARPHLMPTFVDNHDVDRFLAGATVPALEQALLAMFTLPGIPVVYYGTEQGFTEQRAAMFAAGWGSGGRDRYDTTHPLYRRIAALSALRRAERAFTHGTPVVLAAEAARAGAIAWRMDPPAGGGRPALVVMNTADSEVLLDGLALGVPAGTRLSGLHALGGGPEARPAAQRAGAGGRLVLRLPPRSGAVWRIEADAVLPGGGEDPSPLALDPLPDGPVDGDVDVAGTARPGDAVHLVVDGDLAGASVVQADAQGRFRGRIPAAALGTPGGSGTHRISAYVAAPGGPGGEGAAASRSVRVERRWQLLAEREDPAGDDHGPDGRYRYPTDPSWGDNRQMDLRRVQVFESAGALRLDLAMHRVTRSWNPANGFDHVAFTIFVELPGAPGGARVMPLQHATLPQDMRWHLRLRAHGWSNALFGAEGATADAEGTPLAPAAEIGVDPDTHTVRFLLPAAALARAGARGLSGARVHVTTWDYDGGYRALGAQAAPHAMGGGDAASPRVMDSSGPIELP